jgi:uncharacterized delta-60 repeat protein
MTASPLTPFRHGRRRIAPYLTVALALAVPAALLQAGAPRNSGTLDLAFGTGGRITTDVSGYNDIARAVAVTPRGRIVVAGYAFRPESFDFDVALTRYDRNGSLDASFGSGGRVLTDLGAAAFAAAVAVTPDGHIVVGGGISRIGANDFLLLKYDASGHLDPSFGANGVVVADLFGRDEAMLDMALTANGDIVVAGTVNESIIGRESDLGIARFTSDGSLDMSFGLAGRTRVDLGGSDRAAALALEPNGEAVIAGNTLSPSGNEDIALARFTRDGRLDASFGVDGRVISDFGPSAFVHEMALMADGSIVLVGATPLGVAGSDFLVLRYLRSGELDGAFGNAGRVTTDIGYLDSPFGVEVRANGTIVVAGHTRPPEPMVDDFALAQYDRHGRLDTSFGTMGLVITDFGGAEGAWAVASLPGGGVVAVGTAGYERQALDFAIAAYR